jgi:hypothetical protein
VRHTRHKLPLRSVDLAHCWHAGAVLAAATGATLAELMARLGHSTVAVAMRDQHAAEDRDKAIAAALGVMMTGTVTPISSAKGNRAKTAR